VTRCPCMGNSGTCFEISSSSESFPRSTSCITATPVNAASARPRDMRSRPSRRLQSDVRVPVPFVQEHLAALHDQDRGTRDPLLRDHALRHGVEVGRPGLRPAFTVSRGQEQHRRRDRCPHQSLFPHGCVSCIGRTHGRDGRCAATTATYSIAALGRRLDAIEDPAELLPALPAPAGIAAPDHATRPRNGIEPRRVVQFRVDPAGKKLRSQQIVLSGDPRAHDLSLGVIVGDALYLNAASGWAHYAATARRTTRSVPHRT